MAELSTEMDTSYSPSSSVIREHITATAAIPLQLSSPSPVADEVIEGPSARSHGTEHIEHRPFDPTPPHSSYDIV